MSQAASIDHATKMEAEGANCSTGHHSPGLSTAANAMRRFGFGIEAGLWHWRHTGSMSYTMLDSMRVRGYDICELRFRSTLYDISQVCLTKDELRMSWSRRVEHMSGRRELVRHAPPSA